MCEPNASENPTPQTDANNHKPCANYKGRGRCKWEARTWPRKRAQHVDTSTGPAERVENHRTVARGTKTQGSTGESTIFCPTTWPRDQRVQGHAVEHGSRRWAYTGAKAPASLQRATSRTQSQAMSHLRGARERCAPAAMRSVGWKPSSERPKVIAKRKEEVTYQMQSF